MAHYTTLLIGLILGEHLQILGEIRGGIIKVAFAIQNQRYLWNKAVCSASVSFYQRIWRYI